MYSRSIVFEDPITRVTDINSYMLMIRTLKTLFKVTFDLHDVAVTSPYEITTRWAQHGRKVSAAWLDTFPGVAARWQLHSTGGCWCWVVHAELPAAA